jgi:hypothetical protein
VRRRFFSFFKKSLGLIRWLIGGLCVIWAAGFLFVAPVARSVIGKRYDGAVFIESGRFSGLSGIQLKGVIIAENTEGLTGAPVLRVDKADIAFDPWELLRGKARVGSIRLTGFLFDAAYDTQGQWNFTPLLSRRPRTAQTPGRLPLVELHRGALRISRIEEGRLSPITTISLNGQVAVQTGQGKYSFSLMTDGRFGYGGSTLSGSLKIGEAGEKNRFAAEGNLSMPGTKVLGNAWDMEAIRLVCEFDRQEVLVTHCGFRMGPGKAAIQGAIRRTADNRRELDVDVNLEQFRICDRHQRDTIVYGEPVLRLLDARVRRFLTRFHPTGTGDVRLTFQGLLEDLSKTQIHGTIVSRDVSVVYDMFPYRLDHLQGTITFTGRELTLDQVTARHGEVELQIDGSVGNFGPHPTIDLRTTSENMRFDEDLYNALNPSIKQVWHSFSPRGTTGVDYRYQRGEDDTKEMALTLELKDAGLVYEHFPYPLENMTGQVVISKEGVTLRDIVSHYDDERNVTLNGEVRIRDAEQPEINIHIEAEEIPVKNELIDAMPAAQQAFFKELEFDAVARSVHVDVFPDHSGERFWDYKASIRVDGKSFSYTGFPLPLEDVHLDAEITQDLVHLNQFSGNTDGGQISMSGQLVPKGTDEDHPGLCLELRLEQFNLNDTFWTAAGEDADRLLGKLRVRGRMDVNGKLSMNFPGESCPRTDLHMTCSGNPVLWDDRSLGRAYGQLHLKDDGLLFDAFQLKGLELDSIPEALLEGPLKGAYTGIRPRGKADVRIDDGILQVGESGVDQIDIKGAVILYNVTAGDKEAIRGLSGAIAGRLGFDREKKAWQVSVSCSIDHFNYHRWRVSNLLGNFAYDPDTARLEGSGLMADFYGGKLIGVCEVDLGHEETVGYKLGLSLNDVDVPQLLAADSEDSLNRIGQGVAGGMLTLEGDLKAIAQSSGKMTASVTNMQLGRQSLPGKILTAVQFKQPDEYIFSEVKAEAYIRQSEVIIEDIRMAGKPLVFRGTGKVDLQQKQIEMDWVAYDRLIGSEDTILDFLARGIGSAIWKVEVRGDLNEPQVNAVFLSVLKQPLNIFEAKP